MDGGSEDDELPYKAPCWWQATEGNHEDEDTCSNERRTLAHAIVLLHVGGAGGDFYVGCCNEGADVGEGVGCYIEAYSDNAKGIGCGNGEEQVTDLGNGGVCEHTLHVALWDGYEVTKDDGKHGEGQDDWLPALGVVWEEVVQKAAQET